MLKQLSALIIFTSLSFPQDGDSLQIQNIPAVLDTIPTKQSDTTSIADTSGIVDTTVQKDTLVPIQGTPLADVSTIIDKRTFLFENYRYTGDLL
ncbi:MAG: hypothetical protein ACHQLA_01675, partial [Ignavibacteriales bacterium]